MNAAPLRPWCRPVRIAVCCVVLLTMAAVAGAEMTFAVIGDFGASDDTAGSPTAKVANLVKGWEPEFVLTLGDNNYGRLGGPASQWSGYVGAHYGDYMLGDGRFPEQTSKTQRFFPSLGNHDSGGPAADSQAGGSAANYLDYFHRSPGKPEGRLPTGSGRHEDTGTYYDFVRGDVHFFAVDSDHAITSKESRATQERWLREGLAASTSPVNIVYFHHPAYTSGNRGGAEAMRWDYQDWGADLVLSGHDHHYERIMLNGFPYVTAGTGGRAGGTPKQRVAGSEVMLGDIYGGVRIHVDGSIMTLEFFSLAGGDGKDGGELMDTLRIDTSHTAITASFQQGVAEYAGTVDTFVQQANPSADNAEATPLNVDSDDPPASGKAVQTLIRFDDLFGEGDLQIPTGAVVESASLELEVFNDGQPIEAHRMIATWTGTATWDSLKDGVAADDTEAVAEADTVTGDVGMGVLRVDVTASVAAWLATDDPAAANRGWVLMPTAANGVDFSSCEGPNAPRLVIRYTLPRDADATSATQPRAQEVGEATPPLPSGSD